MDEKNKHETPGGIFIRMLLHPVFIIVYGIAWFFFSQLCQYGRPRINIPVLAICGAFFIFWLILYIVRVISNRKKPSDSAKAQKKGRSIYTLMRALILIAITLGFGIRVAFSASNLNGYLAWRLQDLRDMRSITLEHTNIYEDGIEGILADIDQKVNLPDSLYISNEFDLIFLSDGTISSFYTYLYGKNEHGDTESFLISYDREKSAEMTVYLHGVANETYSQAMSLSPLLDTLRRVDLRETVGGWAEQSDKFGILYYGIRSWGYNPEGIVYVSPESMAAASDMSIEDVIVNYTVSVYIPGLQEGELLAGGSDIIMYHPIRYIPVDDLNAIRESNSIASQIYNDYTGASDNSEETDKVGNCIENSDGSLEFFLTDTTGYRLEVVDSAAGSRFYSLLKTDDGINWAAENIDPFVGSTGVAYGIAFLSNELGFISLSHSGGDYGELYRTEDGGKTFYMVEIPEVEVEYSPDFSDTPFDYPLMPYCDENLLMLEVGQGADGDYNGGCRGLFKSEDDGKSWSYVGETVNP